MSTLSPDPKHVPCKACRHPRDASAKSTAASTTLTELRQGSDQGCVACHIFISAIETLMTEAGDAQDPKQDSRVTLKFRMSTMGDSLALFVIEPQLHISFYSNKHTPWLKRTLPDLPLGYSVPHSTCSDASVDWTRYQLQRCTSLHESCRRPSEAAPPMPKRVLHIGATSTNQIHLCEPANLREPYACISYCWGRSRFLSTTSTSIDNHRRGIPWNSLPLTFRDAISFLRKLHIRFLWVDSLCILQDDMDDWEREAGQMASIYQNAHLVISAIKSIDAHGGLFANLDPKFETHVYTTPYGNNEELCFRRSLTHMPSPLDFASGDPLPTLSRGWIFQERLLASRVLHFGPQELIWECSDLTTCQCTETHSLAAAQSPRMWSRYWGNHTVQLKHTFHLQNWVSWDDSRLGRCWHQLVQEYTKLHLTYDTDVFPAFSGIASRFGEASKSKSLAGLWEKTLLNDLLWHVEQFVGNQKMDSMGMTRPAIWRAPTWSWASVRVPVSYTDTFDGLEPCCSVDEAVCETSGTPTGKVLEAYVVLRGNMIPMILEHSIQEAKDTTPWNLYRLDAMKGRVHNVWADCNTSIQGIDHLPDGIEVYCFPVGKKKLSGAVEALILKKAGFEEDTQCVLYERIGALEVPRAPLDELDEWTNPSERTETVKIL